MHAVSASTSAGSTAGNMAIRNWLRPSLRYGSGSTIPFAPRGAATFGGSAGCARGVAATLAASTVSAKSMVPTTWERCAGSVTNGVAYGTFSAQVYRRDDESA